MTSLRTPFLLAASMACFFAANATFAADAPSAYTPTTPVAPAGAGQNDLKEKFENATPEQKAALKDKLENATPEQKAQAREKMKEHIANMTPEQKAAAREKMKERIATMTPEQKAAFKEKMQARRASGGTGASAGAGSRGFGGRAAGAR